MGTPKESTSSLYNYINERKSFTLTATNVFMYKECIDIIGTLNFYTSPIICPNTLQINLFCTEYMLHRTLNKLPEGVQCDTH